MKLLYYLRSNVLKHKLKYVRCYTNKHPVDYNSLKLVFFGTDSFSLPSLKLLHKECQSNQRLKLLEVVTSFKAVENPVKDYAHKQNLKLFDFKEFQHRMDIDYDLGIVVSFGHLIPEHLIESFPLGILNVHASLLPKYRGAAPIIYAIRNGDTSTGITIMKIRPKRFDIGEIVLQKVIEIDEDEVMPKLHERLANEGAELLLDCVRNLPESLINITPQAEADATYAPKIDENFTHVRWNQMTSKQVYDLYRSLYSFKFVSTTWHGHPVKIKELKFDKTENCYDKYPPGYVTYCRDKKCLNVYCGDGNPIQVHSLGIGKKSKISAHDFNNGFLKKRPPNERLFTD